MSHYFTDNRQLPKNRKEFSFRFSSFNYSFTTDDGVFCKNEVDFGSWALLKALEKETLGERILDLGCGWGPIGIIVKSMNPKSTVLMAEVNPRAAELAMLNCKKNRADNEVRVSDCFEKVPETFTDILINPPIRAGKAVIYKMFEESFEHLENHGSLWVVIRKQQGADSARKKIASIFEKCDIIAKEKGYNILKATKNV